MLNQIFNYYFKKRKKIYSDLPYILCRNSGRQQPTITKDKYKFFLLYFFENNNAFISCNALTLVYYLLTNEIKARAEYEKV